VAERFYFKMWHSWWTTESHEDLEEDPIAIGPVLMSFCRWSPGDDCGWAVTEKGTPVTCNALARRARWKGPRAGERVAAALRKLEEVGTADLRSDGAWGLPKFGRFQESAEAAKKRKQRDKSGTTASDVPKVSPDCPALVEVESEVKSPVVPKGTRSPDLIVDHVLAAMRGASAELGGRGPRDNPANRKLIARISTEVRATPEDWTHVIQAQLHSVRGEPKNHKYLTLSTLCVPTNFLRLLDAPLPRVTGVATDDTTAADLRAERDARRVQVELEERLQAGGDA
jgi:hypothetical protein